MILRPESHWRAKEKKKLSPQNSFLFLYKGGKDGRIGVHPSLHAAGVASADAKDI